MKVQEKFTANICKISHFINFWKTASSFNVLDVDQEGFTLYGKKCSNFLSSQWNKFENLKILQRYRVYRSEELQRVISKSFFEKNVVLTCSVCTKKKKFHTWKESTAMMVPIRIRIFDQFYISQKWIFLCWRNWQNICLFNMLWRLETTLVPIQSCNF